LARAARGRCFHYTPLVIDRIILWGPNPNNCGSLQVLLNGLRRSPNRD
jgi:hypothetical protein